MAAQRRSCSRPGRWPLSSWSPTPSGVPSCLFECCIVATPLVQLHQCDLSYQVQYHVHCSRNWKCVGLGGRGRGRTALREWKHSARIDASAHEYVSEICGFGSILSYAESYVTGTTFWHWLMRWGTHEAHGTAHLHCELQAPVQRQHSADVTTQAICGPT